MNKDLIRKIRLALKMSQHDLAKALKVTQGTISGYENGVLSPPIKRIRELYALAKKNKIKLKQSEIIRSVMDDEESDK